MKIYSFFILLFSSSIFAQDNTYLFYKTFCEEPASHCKGRDVIPIEEGYIVFGMHREEAVDSMVFYAKKMNHWGQELDFKILKKGVLSQEFGTYEIAFNGSKISKSSDGHFYLAYGHQYDMENHFWQMSLIKINEELDVIWDKQYETEAETTTGTNKSIVDSEGNVLLVGIKSNPFEDPEVAGDASKLFVRKVDPNGNELWTKHYLDEEPDALSTWGHSVVETPDGGYLLGGRGEYGWPDNENAILFKIDNDGNFEWYRNYEGDNPDYPMRIIKLESGYQLATSFLYNGLNRSIRLIRLDENFEEIWDKKYSYNVLPRLTELEDIISTNDGGFVGRAVYEFKHPETEDRWDQVALIKFDEEGEVVWVQPYIINPEKHCYAWDFDLAPDGGFVLTGHQNYPLPQMAWVMKTDQEGNTCSFANCDSLVVSPDTTIDSILPQMLEFASLYPNPVQEQKAQLFYNTTLAAHWSIYDLNGRLLKEQLLSPNEKSAVMDLHKLPKGLYFYRVWQKERLLGEGKFSF